MSASPLFLSFPPFFSHVVSLPLSLRPLDVEFMRRLSKVVNIVPVIAKADTLTLEERDFFKKKVILFCLPFDLLCVFSIDLFILFVSVLPLNPHLYSINILIVALFLHFLVCVVVVQ